MSRIHQYRRVVAARFPEVASATSTASGSSTSAFATSSPAPDAKTSAMANMKKLPTSVAAIVAVASVLAFIVISVFAVWKYRTAKRRTRAGASLAGKFSPARSSFADEKHVDLENVSIYMEKPKQAVLVASCNRDIQVGWVPQIKIQTSPDVLASPKPSKKKQQSKQLTLHSDSVSSIEPPPSYDFANKHYGKGTNSLSSVIPLPPTPLERRSVPPTPPTPPVSKTFQSMLSVKSSSTNEDDTPLPSPVRSESFAAAQLAYPPGDMPRTPSDSDWDVASSLTEDSSLPRLMSVTTTFTPSMSDELPIKIGDTVRMIEEYRDEWCLVQHVGTIDSPRGVVPRLCLQERKRIVPTRKTSNASTRSAGWR